MNKFKGICYVIMLLVIFSSKISYCEPVAVQEATRIQQKELLEQSQIQRKELMSGNDNQVNTKPEVSEEKNRICVSINEIIFDDRLGISNENKDKIEKGYTGNCILVNEIKNLINSLSNDYISQGYITSKVIIDAKKIKHGILGLNLFEGKIESISIDGDSNNLTSMVFPGLIGNKLNLRDLEQGLEQLNKLNTKIYNINILPGDKPGYSKVLISSKIIHIPVRMNITTDNNGQKNTGENQYNLYGTYDTPFGLGEKISVSWGSDTDFSRSHYSNNFSSGITIPYGYWTLNYNYMTSKSLQQAEYYGMKFPYKGKTEIQSILINRLTFRDKDSRLNFGVGLTHKNILSELAGQKLYISSPKLTSVSLNSQYTSVIGSGYLTFNPSIEKGLSFWDTTKDMGMHNSPKQEYVKYILSASYYYPFTDSFDYLVSTYGQYSTDNLYGAERISVGGIYSVRGFKDLSISGNNGFYLRQELSYTGYDNDQIKINLIGAIDYGFIQQQNKYGIDTSRLTGASVGLSAIYNKMSSQISVGFPIKYPSDLTPDDWNINWQLKLYL